MSVGINPVSAATATQASAYAPGQPPSQTGGTDDATGPDPRRYTQFDRTSIEAGTAHLSFGDFMDMINPLEHIPVISSVYRAVTGDTINPVSRVAGDILYGGALGAASAVFGGISAVADASLEESTGKDSGGIAIAMLFGPDDDKDKTAQLADAGNAAAAPVSANGNKAVQLADAGSIASTSAQNPAPASVASQSPVRQNIEIAQAAQAAPMIAALAVPAKTQTADAGTLSLPSPQNLMAQATAAASAGTTSGVTATLPSAALAPPSVADGAAAESPGGISLASAKRTSKQPYGGVMAPALPNSNAQEMALALSQGAPAMRMGHTIYANRLVNGSHPAVPMLSSGGAPNNGVVAPAPTVPAPVFTPVSSSASVGAAQTPASSLQNFQNDPLPAGLMQDMMFKAVGQYKGTAALGTGGGSSVNLLN